jgi:peptide chain release factor subunit 1
VPVSREDIDWIANFDTHGACTLSLFVSLAPERQVEKAYRTVFKDLVKGVRAELGEGPTRKQFDFEVERVNAWLDDQPEPPGTGLAVFSSTPAGLWAPHVLHVPLRDRLVFDARPYVQPLVDLFDQYERYMVALVDNEKARLFSVFLGEIEESHDFADFVPPKHDQGGVSQANFQRHHEAHVFRHLKKVADYLTNVFRQRPFDRLVLAGPEEPIATLRRLLHRPLASRVVATLPAELSANLQEILQKTLDIERNIERQIEERLLAELFETANAGGLARYGIEPTLEALFFGQVWTLVVADGVQAEGTECSNCGRLVLGAPDQCPACGGPMQPLRDVFERAIERSLQMAGSVEIVHGQAAEHLRQAGGGLGALLRFQ